MNGIQNDRLHSWPHWVCEHCLWSFSCQCWLNGSHISLVEDMQRSLNQHWWKKCNFLISCAITSFFWSCHNDTFRLTWWEVAINNYSIVFGWFLMYNYKNKSNILGWKIEAEIPTGICDTAVQVCGYAQCPNLVTIPVPMEPVSETPWVFPHLWQTLFTQLWGRPRREAPSKSWGGTTWHMPVVCLMFSVWFWTMVRVHSVRFLVSPQMAIYLWHIIIVLPNKTI